MNGYLFVSLPEGAEVDKTGLEKVARVVNCIKILENNAMFINAPKVESLYNVTIKENISVNDMLLQKNQDLVVMKYREEMS